ncbi:MAG: hypothetical protein HFE54_00240 [Turicibacter sp.]|uniref:Uncharacterized protein n=1 Tax=Turicibacter faecis TaxID=2963365 RepID=A0ABN6Z999_9FIRM|nr:MULTISPECIES: hypothetical protein [unclassified Turicibacter]MCI8700864.1 hypothetical protein [Turicibacter sp.]BEH90404.1 hypothetical protein T23_05060 [Turicibacter sp. TC023]MCI9350351.1 hypothetical protein [Turicibacter sp.]MCU7204582.1 hypothetical protein [Turicibacter sp. TA25]MCU7210020.1 hypothetical protein [Turicibacter sp. 1E2]
MKKVISIILAIVITGIGLTIAFSYQTPKTKTYSTLSEIDKKIENETTVSDLTIEKNVSQLYEAVQALITLGETYTEGTETDQAFETFNQAYDETKKLEVQLAEFIKTDVTSKLEKTTSALTEDQKKVATEAIDAEKKRLDTLKTFNQQLSALNKNLKGLKENFDQDKPSTAIQYFNSVTTSFNQVKDSYNDYVEATNHYYQLKEKLYEVLKTA